MILKWGEFELDVPKFELKKRGQSVAVQPKVLDLIVYLASHRDRVVTKDELFEQVWEGTAVTEASLSQAISLARRAVDDTPDAQHTIRTVRGKGFRFVGAAEQSGGLPASPATSLTVPISAAAPSPRRPLVQTPLGSSVAETMDEPGSRARISRPKECLFVVAHSELAGIGGARYSLEDTDEVVFTRGTTRRAERTGAITRVLTLHLPGPSLSRDHARLVRTRTGWLVTDDGSKNGTFVNDQRVQQKSAVKGGDFVRCGRTLLWLESFPLHEDMPPDADYQAGLEGPFVTLMPELWALGRDLQRVAAADVPVLITGETGVGKERTARAIHRSGNRAGPLVVLDAGLAAPKGGTETPLAAAIRTAAGGTLIIEHVDQASAEDQAALVRVLDDPARRADVRFIATSTSSLEDLLESERVRSDLVTRLAGFRLALPALRQRVADLGCLIAVVGADARVPVVDLDVAALTALVHHSWPGNVRELKQALEVAHTLARGGPIRRDHLPPHLRGSA